MSGQMQDRKMAEYKNTSNELKTIEVNMYLYAIGGRQNQWAKWRGKCLNLCYDNSDRYLVPTWCAGTLYRIPGKAASRADRNWLIGFVPIVIASLLQSFAKCVGGGVGVSSRSMNRIILLSSDVRELWTFHGSSRHQKGCKMTGTAHL